MECRLLAVSKKATLPLLSNNEMGIHNPDQFFAVCQEFICFFECRQDVRDAAWMRDSISNGAQTHELPLIWSSTVE